MEALKLLSLRAHLPPAIIAKVAKPFERVPLIGEKLSERVVERASDLEIPIGSIAKILSRTSKDRFTQQGIGAVDRALERGAVYFLEFHSTEFDAPALSVEISKLFRLKGLWVPVAGAYMHDPDYRRFLDEAVGHEPRANLLTVYRDIEKGKNPERAVDSSIELPSPEEMQEANEKYFQQMQEIMSQPYQAALIATYGTRFKYVEDPTPKEGVARLMENGASSILTLTIQPIPKIPVFVVLFLPNILRLHFPVEFSKEDRRRIIKAEVLKGYRWLWKRARRLYPLCVVPQRVHELLGI